MVLVLDKKPLEGVWWKYGAALAALHLTLWVVMGYRLHPDIELWALVSRSYVVYGAFAVAAFLPFALGRLGLMRAMWTGVAGWALAVCAYFLLALFEPTRRIPLLPFSSFLQIYSSLLVIGLVVELGRYVWRKVFEE